MSELNPSEPIDVEFEYVKESGEPALPIVLSGVHARFIGWTRVYTIRVAKDFMQIEGPFEDDHPNATEEYFFSQSTAGKWVVIRPNSFLFRIPGRGKWSIDISGAVERELCIARIRAWIAELRGKDAGEYVRKELHREFFRVPMIYSAIQLIFVVIAAIVGLAIGGFEIWTASLNGLMVALYGCVYYNIGIRGKTGGLLFGFLLNAGMMFLPLIEAYLTGGANVSMNSFFFPFCFSPLAITIPLAMMSYGYAWLEYPRQRGKVTRG